MKVRSGRSVTDAELPVDFDLLEIAVSVPDATPCLTSALSHHNLTDAISAVMDIALPKGCHRPRTDKPAGWHVFDSATFEIGREERCLDREMPIGIYGPERSIIDAVRLLHLEGPELGHEALGRWLRRPKSSSADLIAMAEKFPKAYREIRRVLEILL